MVVRVAKGPGALCKLGVPGVRAGDGRQQTGSGVRLSVDSLFIFWCSASCETTARKTSPRAAMQQVMVIVKSSWRLLGSGGYGGRLL